MAVVAPRRMQLEGEVAPLGRSVLAEERALPVLGPLEALLPGGLRRGTTVAISGSTALALAVLAGPSAAGSWGAVVGVPTVGLAAAAELGVVLDRLALVAPPPAGEWATVVAALLDAVDVVLVPGGRLRPPDLRRLAARGRERGAVLVVLGAADGAEVRLAVTASTWEGLGAGHGHLRARRVTVTADGRGAASRPRRAELWLPGPDGSLATVAVHPDLRAVG